MEAYAKVQESVKLLEAENLDLRNYGETFERDSNQKGL